MAVNVSTTASVCLYCKISSASDTEKEFHEIYDEVGIELQLPTLVEKFFQIKLQNKGKQECLCEDCVNRLVELFDLEEHAKEEAATEKEATVLSSKIETEVSNDVFENESVKFKVNKDTRKSFENSLDTHLTQIGEDEIVADSDNDINLNVHKEDQDKDQANSDLDDNESSVTKNIILQNNLQEEITSDNDIDLTLNDHQEDLYNSNLDDIECSVTKNIQIQNNFQEETTSDNDVDLNLNDFQEDHSKDQYNSDLDDIDISVAKNIENENNLQNNFTIQDISIKSNQHFIEQDKEPNYSDLEDIENYEDNNNKANINLSQNLDDIKSYENRNQSQNINTNLNNSESLLQNKQLEKREESDPVAASESENNEDFDDDDDITYVEEKDELNFNIQDLINTNTNDDEFVIVNEADAISNDDNDDEDIQSSNDNEKFTEENIYENVEIYEALLDTSTIDTDNPNTQDIIIEEIQLEDKNLKTENADHDVYTTNDQNVVENLNISKENEILIDSDGKSFNSNDIELDEIIVKEVNDIEDDTYSIEEEYLIEEIACSQEYDSVDLNEYLEKVLVTKFQDLELDWKLECKLCQEPYETFQDLIKHNCIKDLEEEQQFCCIIKECKENFNDLNTLARHLILQHYNKLDSLTIYGKCLDCQKSFSNFLEFNKHSCCRSIKRRTGSRNYCQYCDMDFQSLKRFVFHMQFHLTNHRPKVCLLCGDLFNNSNDFFEHTQYKHSTEANMACIKCDRFFREKEVYDKHMELHDDAKYQYACIYCPKLYTNKYSLNKHMDIYHNNKSKALFCEYCEKEFVNNSSYRNHMKSHATDVQVETFICCSCGFLTNSDECIRDHTETDCDSPCYAAPIEEHIIGFGYSCENCSIDFHTPKQLKEHRLSSIHNDDIYYCGICRRTFNNLRQMRNHMGNHKDSPKWEEIFPITRYFVCNIGDCQESYPIWTSLYYHKKRPHKTAENEGKPQDFKCQFCQQNCTSKMSLAVHVARSHNNSNIICPHCKQTYRSQKLLQEHIDKFHTPIKCEICLKDFKHRRNLESHNQLVHLNIKRYFCSVCQKGYFYKSEKDAHEKKVHPEFSYKCEICNFITNYPKSLEIHMDKHNNQQKFKCEVCSKTFGRKQLLNVHLKRHQNKKEFLCSAYAPECNCSASFYTYNQLKTHIQNKHPESKYITENKRKKITKRTHIDLEDDEEDAYEMIYADDNDSIQVKRIKSSNESVPIDVFIEDVDNGDEDGEYDKDGNEITLQQEMDLDEEKSDEYETICS